MLKIALLVSHAAFRQDLEKWVPDFRLRQSPFGHRTVQAQKVMAVEVTDQIGRAELEGSPDLFHRYPSLWPDGRVQSLVRFPETTDQYLLFDGLLDEPERIGVLDQRSYLGAIKATRYFGFD